MTEKYYVFGNFTLDDTVTNNDQVIRRAPGGNGLYGSVGAHLWTENISVVTRIGYDYPENYLNILREAGFDLKGILRLPDLNIHLWILYEENGERQMIYQKGSGKCNYLDPTPDQVAVEEGSFSYVCSMIFASQQKLLQNLRHKCRIACDAVSFIEGVDIDDYRKLENFSTIELYLPSIEEILSIWGQEPSLELMREIANSGPKVIAVKMGRKGSLVFDFVKNRILHVPINNVNTIDPTGAGDAYCAGFMVGYNQTGDTIEASLMGTVSASFVVEDYGGLHVLSADKKEINRRREELRSKVIIEKF